jgi:hypothetical protein
MKKKLILMAGVVALFASAAAVAFAAPNRSDKFYLQSADGDEVRISSHGAIRQTGSFGQENSLSSTTINGTFGASGTVTLTDVVSIARFRTPTNGSSYAVGASTSLTSVNMDKTFMVLTSTGGAVTLGATPTIATTTFTNGDRYTILSATDTLTFSDNGTVSGTLLELGSTTRALGVGDILQLIYLSGKWYEIGYQNN